MAPFSQRLEPPQNPGRFKAAEQSVLLDTLLARFVPILNLQAHKNADNDDDKVNRHREPIL
jgi:hypothetical protein